MKLFFQKLLKSPAAILTCSLLLLSLLSVLWTLGSPAPAAADAGGFSAERAYGYVEEISKAPHSSFEQTELERVRNYIKATTAAIVQPIGGAITTSTHSVTVTNIGVTPSVEVTVPVNNIYAEIPADKPNGSYVLLMAHYDSCPAKIKNGIYTADSYGAGDDGYGVATMIEILELLVKQKLDGKVFENGVKFVFTDAEEVALGGAAALVEENPNNFLDDVNLVINVEARGMRGPLFMFQTSAGNKAVMDLYSSAQAPFTFSIASDVYAILDNDTDFSPFLKSGYAGMNFSVLDSLKEYHTPDDNLTNVSKSALQAYGNQILPIINEYTSNAKYSPANYFTDSVDAVFFTLLPFLFICYSQTASWIFIALLFIGAGFSLFFAIKKKVLNWKKALLAFGLWFGFIIAAAIAGLLLSLLIGLITGVKFNLMNMAAVPFGLGFLLIFAVGLIVAAYFFRKLFKKLGCKFFDVYTGFLFLLLVFTLLTAFFLHGGTYLFVWPAAFMAGYLGLRSSGKKQKWAKILGYVLSSFALVISFMFFAYLVYSLFLALTFGALAVELLFAAMLGGFIITNSESQFSLEEKTAE